LQVVLRQPELLLGLLEIEIVVDALVLDEVLLLRGSVWHR